MSDMNPICPSPIFFFCTCSFLFSRSSIWDTHSTPRELPSHCLHWSTFLWTQQAFRYHSRGKQTVPGVWVFGSGLEKVHGHRPNNNCDRSSSGSSQGTHASSWSKDVLKRSNENNFATGTWMAGRSDRSTPTHTLIGVPVSVNPRRGILPRKTHSSQRLEASEPADWREQELETGRFWTGTRFWHPFEDIHARGGDAMVPCTRDPDGLAALLHSSRHVEHWLHFCWDGHEEAPVPWWLGDWRAVQDFQAAGHT